ncbi:MAG: hypothetical protein QW343_01530 [Candidatus Norongarragalinales archaeon]
MKTVLLDSSALLALVDLKLDAVREVEELIEEPLRFVVLKPCLSELRVVAKPSAFHVIMRYLQQRGASVADAPQAKADEAILAFASRNPNCIVATLDARLRKKLKKEGVQTITLHGAKLVVT